MSEVKTKAVILDAAEQLFAMNGFAATSLRAIIKNAGVNTAAIHYHFGSKEGLIDAVLRRRAAPVNACRLAQLDALEARHPSDPLPLEPVIEAFLAPAIQHLGAGAAGDEPTARLFGRAISEPDDKLRAVIHEVFVPVFDRFSRALGRALPALPEEEVRWRMHFMIGVMVFTVTVPKMHDFDKASAESPSAMIHRLVDFIAGGMKGPATDTTAAVKKRGSS